MRAYCDGCLGNHWKAAKDYHTIEVCSSCNAQDAHTTWQSFETELRNALAREYRVLSHENVAKEGVPTDCFPQPVSLLMALKAILSGANQIVVDHAIDVFQNERGQLPLLFKIRDFAQTTWLQFVLEVHAHSRFFSTLTYDLLNDVFSFLENPETLEKVTVVFDPEQKGPFVRARLATTIDELRQILAYPGDALGPPPPGMANAGRLNPAGVPVFYGASDQTTAITELRPQVGSLAATATFSVLRRVRLLDLTKVKSFADKLFDEEKNRFSPRFEKLRHQASFLRYFVRQMKLPIGSNLTPEGYLDTQVISEFLSERYSNILDGIKFQSVQSGESEEFYNVALFNHACSLDRKSLTASGKPIKISLKASPFALTDEDVLVFNETIPPMDIASLRDRHLEKQYGRKRLPVLTLDTGSIQVSYCSPTPSKHREVPLEPLT